jgi:hypothetical protein
VIDRFARVRQALNQPSYDYGLCGVVIACGIRLSAFTHIRASRGLEEIDN